MGRGELRAETRAGEHYIYCISPVLGSQLRLAVEATCVVATDFS